MNNQQEVYARCFTERTRLKSSIAHFGVSIRAAGHPVQMRNLAFQAVWQLKPKAQSSTYDGCHQKYEPLASVFRQHQVWDIFHSRNIGASSVAERSRSQLPTRMRASCVENTNLAFRRHHKSYDVHKK